MAASAGQLEVLQLLLASGGGGGGGEGVHDKGGLCFNGCTPAHYAARQGHEACLRYLVSGLGADPEAADAWHGRTPLHYAAFHGHEGCGTPCAPLSASPRWDRSWETLNS